MSFERVLVVGAGQMGAGIAQVVAASGRQVLLHDPFPGAVERGLAGMQKSLERLEAKGGAPASDVLARVTETAEIVAADLMIEAIVEEAAAKEELFRAADSVLPPEAVLASNTSSIPITSLAAVTSRPDRVIGMHFFNPVPVLQLVEVIRALQTSDETTAAIVELAEDLGKVPAEANDFPGFVSNRILMPFVNEAAYALMGEELGRREEPARRVTAPDERLDGDDGAGAHVEDRLVVDDDLLALQRRLELAHDPGVERAAPRDRGVVAGIPLDHEHLLVRATEELLG